MSRVYDFGLGGQIPDSSTKFVLYPNKGSKATLIGKGQFAPATLLGKAFFLPCAAFVRCFYAKPAARSHWPPPHLGQAKDHVDRHIIWYSCSQLDCGASGYSPEKAHCGQASP